MNSFWSLVGYEYKKILHKRSVQIILLLAAIVTAVSVCGTLLGNYYIDGKVYESNYDAAMKDRSYARSLAGREINSELILEAANAYAQIPETDRYIDTPEYETYARKYSQIYNNIRAIYNTNSNRVINMADFKILTADQAGQLYQIRRERQIQNMKGMKISNKAKEELLALDTQIKTPFTFSYTDGYTRFFSIMITIGLLAAFVMAVLISPLFAGEYTSGADQLILAAKHGKHKLIHAKLFTGFSLAAALFLMLVLISYILTMLIFGSDGRNAPLQLYYAMSPYPFTMGQTALLLSACAFFACLLTASVTMLLSAKFKSPFGVIILISLLLVAPMFISISDHTSVLLIKLYNLLPANMMSFGSVIDGIPYEFFGFVFLPYQFLPLFAIAITILLTPFAYRVFKRHQIS